MTDDADRVVLIGVNYHPFWPFGRTEEKIAVRDSGTRFEITDFEKRQYDKLIERAVGAGTTDD